VSPTPLAFPAGRKNIYQWRDRYRLGGSNAFGLHPFHVVLSNLMSMRSGPESQFFANALLAAANVGGVLNVTSDSINDIVCDGKQVPWLCSLTIITPDQSDTTTPNAPVAGHRRRQLLRGARRTQEHCRHRAPRLWFPL
jgi:hypothetical protein